ncbi:putative acetyl-CoA carboxylase, biotin carboxyl carrier protein [Bordetella bronchiseptica E014]|uniref:acetyl-CoA carboxylase biotin carboxyl carrier protein n=1 Tax=Bordetella bronchiseptica TaxID=518 RepID=UPI0002900746|nr:biotin/lipoyl-containing protein [Bordetella bronchiseptica]AZW33086.1 acetyl-CoA carboxylase biotin carboxyl carrier protein subunit [Bordetella bronchiseptica]KCV41975.1 putative acetyl-CoA carboxylase, biotin carboxyl carrier protein [Bordetella bronchiseptica 345]KCV50329.1 putative acetyl-CoA carboxylase, biotin carboxyl carrier protein [Bordetella bronchiseptica 7E71]KDC17074.1 putative acetyl-CoA carboxylase, biotin carboxyl carrier protein [Bordetella bronchiseptica F-1]KDC17147.1 p
MSEKSRLVQDLIVLAAEERIAELVVSEAGRTIRVLRGAASGQPPAGDTVPAGDPAQPHPAASPAAAGEYTVTAPLTGTFYRAARPGAQPLAAPGDRLAAHAPVCVIEAMKMMTEVSAERAGAVLRVLCEDGQAVEQGQPLLVIQPDEPRHVP